MSGFRRVTVESLRRGWEAASAAPYNAMRPTRFDPGRSQFPYILFPVSCFATNLKLVRGEWIFMLALNISLHSQ